MDLQASGRKTATVATLIAIFVIAVVWGLHEVTQPFPGKAAPPPVCEDVPVAAGHLVKPDQVLVNVLNDSNRSGLAENTQVALARYGFATGERGDTQHPMHGAHAEVWTTSPKSPAALLVASYLGRGVHVVRKDAGYPGITVVVGDTFRRVHHGMKSIKAAKKSEVCQPSAAS